MFEFWKRISKEDKIKKLNSSNSVTYVASRELKKEISDWGRDISPTNISFSELLCKLGFDKERILYLERIPDVDNVSIKCSYDKEMHGAQRIDLCLYESSGVIGRYRTNNKIITLSGDGYRRVYNCHLSSFNDFELKLVKDVVKKNLNDSNTYERSLNINKGVNVSFKNMRTIHYNGSVLVVKDGYYDEIIIKVIPNQINFINNDIMKMENEDRLIDYLDSITEDTRIEDVYKKICEISLEDEDKYKEIEIIFKRLDKEEARLTYSLVPRNRSICFGYKYQVNDGDRNYIYKYIEPNKYNISSLDCFKIIISKGNYHFVLIVNPIDYVSGMKLDNSLELRDYLCGLEFPISIGDVYKKICEISLGDINKYRWMNMKCCYGKDTIDGEEILSLCLENGEFKSYSVIDDGKEIKISNDEKFSYVNKSFSREMVVDMNGELVTNCQVSSQNGIESDNMGNSIYDGINEAKDVKVKTKKLIDNLMNRNNN